MTTELITKSFAAQCLAFPDRVETALAEISTVSGAKELLDKASAMQHYAARLKAGIEVERPIALGVLKIKAKLGELMPAKPPSDRGQGRSGKSGAPGALDFSKHSIAAYRKLAANRKRLQEYYDSIDEVPTQTDFLKSCVDVVRKAREKKRDDKRRANARKARQTARIDSLEGVFSTLLIDPPWSWDDEGDVNQLGRAKPDYATMTIDELLALPVGKMAADDSHLYCWVTNRSLPKVFALLDAWGFRYITLLTWPKQSFGMGNYFRGQTEHIAFGVRGSLPLKVKDASTLLPSWKRGRKHSAKPSEIHAFIERCSHGPYLELFGRKAIPNWRIWGADA